MDACRASRRFGRAGAAAALVIGASLAACSSSSGSSATTTTGATTTIAATTTVATTVASSTSTVAGSTTVAPGPIWGPPGSGTLARADEMQQALDNWVRDGHLKGVTAAVVTDKGTWAGAAGVDGAGAPLQADSALSIMSVSKTYTAAEVMFLVSREKIRLDAPVTTYLELPFDTRGATVRQLLAMRSGFPSTSADSDSTRMAANLARVWTSADWLAGAGLTDGSRLGVVGGTPRYNSLNYALLAAIVEKVTGTTFAAAVRHDLLAQAGLVRTWVQPAEVPTAPLTVGGTTGHASVVDPASAVMPSVAFASATLGAGSVAADAADTAMWGYLLYGGRVIDPILVREMESDPQPDPVMGDYALGTMIISEGGATMVGHAGGGIDWPYSSAMHVLVGDHPVAVAVITPEAADHGSQIFDLFMRLQSLAAA